MLFNFERPCMLTRSMLTNTWILVVCVSAFLLVFFFSFFSNGNNMLGEYLMSLSIYLYISIGARCSTVTLISMQQVNHTHTHKDNLGVCCVRLALCIGI